MLLSEVRNVRWYKVCAKEGIGTDPEERGLRAWNSYGNGPTTTKEMRKVRAKGWLTTTKGKAVRKRQRRMRHRRLRAKKAGVPYELPMPPSGAGVLNLVAEPPQPANCQMCGVDFDSNNTRLIPTLDRVVPSLGYISGNICWICCSCNSWKGGKSLADGEALLDLKHPIYAKQIDRVRKALEATATNERRLVISRKRTAIIQQAVAAQQATRLERAANLVRYIKAHGPSTQA